ncbi:type I-F CRISPR-associated protein Csy1 [Pusillimonas sp. CC-YST705]|uniref:Type I-F CRISPR-associated protein Csy1 n=2 Tax=Mesopusillimonas faecipullorum TaxID=2755040 RepID=A0ABS8C9G4_9BURK|nr:type I-F CRISPR-associated protein Csy1 [Mesopusillimonas faecipullorum]
MSKPHKETPRSEHFRASITAFIEARRDAKLKGKEDDTSITGKYDYTAWLSDAARRVSQIQAVTHVLKATHPDARGSSLHVPPTMLPLHAEVGSHSLGEKFSEDVVGNAAALDVFKFLKLEVEGRMLLHWMQQADPDLLTALNPDPDIAHEWLTAFCGLVRVETKLASHSRAKQIYWLVGDKPEDNDHYHLLQPLFSSSLAHAVHDEIQDARFGEQNKLARQARRNGDAHDTAYRDYRNLIVRKLGGTKPQNISQLNSERGGMNYLLASLPPPRWQSRQSINLHNRESALDALKGIKQVRAIIRQLANFLLSDPPPTMETRLKREGMEQALGAQLPVFAESVQMQMGSGWTREGCELDLNEQLWLDPGRTQLKPRTEPEGNQSDVAFNAEYARGVWPDQIAARFANWLNAQLYASGLTTVGESEAKHWARQAIVEAAWPVPIQRRLGEIE